MNEKLISPHEPGGYIPGGLNELRDIYKRPYGDLEGKGKVGKIVALTALLGFMTVSVGSTWSNPPSCKPKPQPPVTPPPPPTFPGDDDGAAMNLETLTGTNYLMAQRKDGLDPKIVEGIYTQLAKSGIYV